MEQSLEIAVAHVGSMHFIGIGLQQIAEALVEPARFIGQHEHRAEMERGGPRRSIFVDKAKHLLVETNRHSAPFRPGRDGFAATADTGACNGLRSAERRGGKGCVSTCGCRWSTEQ